jgi:hypothetical protein
MLINHFYQTHTSLTIDGDKLLQVLCHTDWIMNTIESNGQIDECLNLYEWKYHGKEMPRQEWCFYAALNNEQPILNDHNKCWG